MTIYFRALLAVPGCLFLLGSNCGENPTLPSLAGNISSAIVAPCETGGTPSNCLMMTNPLEGKTLAYDFQTKQFVMGPLGTGPLIIENGPLTSYLAYIPEAGNRYYALDIQQGQIFSHKLSGSDAFSAASKETIQLPSSPRSLAFLSNASGHLVAVSKLLSKTGVGVLQVQFIDSATGQAMGLSDTRTYLVNSTDQSVANIFTADYADWTAFTFKDLGGVYFLTAENLIANKQTFVPYSSPSGMGIHMVYFSEREFAGRPGPFALLIGKDQGRLELVSLENPSAPTLVAWFESSALLEIAYLPGRGARTCCNGFEDWMQVIDVAGKVHYLTFEKPAQQEENEDPAQLYLAKTISLEKAFSTVSLAHRPISILPLEDGAERKTIYSFETGLVGISNEGMENFERIQPPF